MFERLAIDDTDRAPAHHARAHSRTHVRAVPSVGPPPPGQLWLAGVTDHRRPRARRGAVTLRVVTAGSSGESVTVQLKLTLTFAPGAPTARVQALPSEPAPPPPVVPAPPTPSPPRLRKLPVIGARSRIDEGARQRLAEISAPITTERDDDLPQRPRTRADCMNMPRPCPFVTCKHHLYLDVNPVSGAIKLNHPDVEVDDLVETCVLDVADRGAVGLKEVGTYLGITLERARQIEAGALPRMRSGAKRHDLG